mmetsp:Transcript_610/g.879  ORF Transcript_610/g.879 Transcript_610/m.879 type:complete len:293 (+) Transcript_610:27-905(+)
MVDRLAEIKTGDDNDLEAGRVGDDGEQYMTDFFQDVGKIKSWLSSFRHNIASIEEIYGQFVTSVTNDQAKETADQLDDLIDETNSLTHKVRDALKKMESENKTQGESSESRIRVNMHNTLTVKFLDLMTQYQEAQRSYKDKNTDKLRRQFRIVNPEMTNEEIEKAIESGETRNVFAAKITQAKYQQEAEDALNYVQNKHKQIKKLESSINELHQLFVDMAVLVEAQGELVNQIEKNVGDAVVYTEKGVQQLKKANEYQRSSRKKMCCLMICLMIIIMVVVIPIALQAGSSDA